MTASWESHPLVFAHSATRVGSDHNPLVVEALPTNRVRSKIFSFESAWIKQEDFKEWLISKWPERQKKRSIDLWRKISGRLRSSLRGWNGNWGGDMKKRKQDLLLLIKNLDPKADTVGLED